MTKDELFEANKKLFECNGFIKLHNYKLIEVNEEGCVVEAPITDECLNPYGIAHGGFTFGLMDTCAGVTVRIFSGRNAVTTSSSINYVKAGKGSKIITKSKVIKLGKNLSIIEVNAYDENNNLITTGIFNYYYID